MKRVATVASLALAVAGVSYMANGQAADQAQQQGDRLQGRVDNEMERSADRVGDRANEAGRDLNRDMNRTDRNMDRVGDRATDRTMAPDGTALAPDAEGIRDVLAQVSQASLTEDGFDDLVERFVDADRNRIGEWLKSSDKEFDDLNAKASALLEKFKAKYNVDEFDIDEDAVFTDQFATIIQSEIGDTARTAGSREGEVRTETRIETRTGDRDAMDRVGDAVGDAGQAVGDAARRSGEAVRDGAANTGIDSPNSEAADANRNDPGRNIATVQIKESHGLPALNVEMIHEFPGRWKIDVPDDVSGEQLYANVSKALDKLAADESKWPQGKNEAYRYVTHNLLLAIHGKNAAGMTLPGGGM